MYLFYSKPWRNEENSIYKRMAYINFVFDNVDRKKLWDIMENYGYLGYPLRNN